MRAFLLNYEAGFINGVFRLPAPVPVVFRDCLSLQEGKRIGKTEGNNTKSPDNSESRKNARNFESVDSGCKD